MKKFPFRPSFLIMPERRLTEQRNPRSMKIDLLSSEEIVDLINSEDRTVPEAVGKEGSSIARAIDLTVRAFREGGRLVYVGAGTSGRRVGWGPLASGRCSGMTATPRNLDAARRWLHGGGASCRELASGVPAPAAVSTPLPPPPRGVAPRCARDRAACRPVIPAGWRCFQGSGR